MTQLRGACTIQIQFGNEGATTVLDWDEYSFASDFLTPCDGFTLKISDAVLYPQLSALLTDPASTDEQTKSAFTALIRNTKAIGPGIPLQLRLVDGSGNSYALATGLLDQLHTEASRGGTTYTFRGRNMLSPLCDSGIDPWSPDFQFAEGMKLSDVVGHVFDYFGINSFWLTDAANRLVTTGVDPSQAKLSTQTIQIHTGESNLLTGDIVEGSTTTQTKSFYFDPSNVFDLSEKSVQKLQPRHDETFMQFIEHQLSRFHLHLWAMNDGRGVVIGLPDYTAGADLGQQIICRTDGTSNVISASAEYDYYSMPALIIAKGSRNGGSFLSTRLKTAKVNEFIGFDAAGNVSPSLQKVLSKFKGLTTIGHSEVLRQTYSKYFNQPDVPRVHYWDDEKSKTKDQLDGAVARKMSEFQRSAIRLNYTVVDHVASNGVPWKHNTIVSVDDQPNGIKDRFWIQSVHHNRSRSSGTTSNLTLIPIGVLQF